MKSSFINRVYVALSFIILTSFSQQSFAQTDRQEKQNAKIDALKQAIASGRYVFMAQSATPMSGRTRQLTYDYKLDVRKDTIISDLPYYGRSFSASYGNTDGGINFNTTNFEYSSKEGPKGGWDINIAPKEIRTVNKMILNITNAGYATLTVTSNTRQQITFNGYIQGFR
ncbi:MAG: DUF4251 domain-containing protein [Bacteroidetes bacterium]|nr:DUF4251 domain-containing protein [Bacteroidota bacterium]